MLCDLPTVQQAAVGFLSFERGAEFQAIGLTKGGRNSKIHAKIRRVHIQAHRLRLVRTAERKQDEAETDGYLGNVG
jgi:hypothetical protein